MLRKSAKKDFLLKLYDFIKKQTFVSCCVEAGLTLTISDCLTQTVQIYIIGSQKEDDWYRLARFTLIGTALIVSYLFR